jgi:hypothetical protein
MNENYINQWSKMAVHAVLQNSMSAELQNRLRGFQEEREQLDVIAEEYQEIVENELMFEEKDRLADLDNAFKNKQHYLFQRFELLRLIFKIPIVLN